MKSWYRITNKGESAEVMIYDEIGAWGITAKRFVEDLGTVTAKHITVRINSPGGQVFDGFAIYSALKAHSAVVAVRVDGLAASIASVIALAGATVTVAHNAFLMIHNPASFAFGDADALRKEAKLLDKLCTSIANVYAEKCGKTVAEIKEKMNEETWFDGAEAKAFGLVDAVADPDEDEESDAEITDVSSSAMKLALKCAKLPDRLKRIAASAAARAPADPPITTTAPKPTETPMSQKIVARDGKHFVTIAGTEHEVEIPTAAAPAAPPVAKLPEAQVVGTTKTPAEQIAEGRRIEREYAAEFDTVCAAAGMSPEVKADFTKTFYGQPMDAVKFQAKYVIGTRAKPVGEGGAGDAPSTDPAAKVASEAEKRFASEAGLRRMWGVNTSDSGADEYKRGLKKYVDAEKRFAADQTPERQKSLAMQGG
jgi:ATP-dependent Clp endopeptidase proteolytic subunit ClpP